MSDKIDSPSEDKIAVKELDNLREKGDWETELSEMAPLKNGLGRRVNRFKELPNGLTPYEMMNGEQGLDDFDYIGKSLE